MQTNWDSWIEELPEQDVDFPELQYPAQAIQDDIRGDAIAEELIQLSFPTSSVTSMTTAEQSRSDSIVEMVNSWHKGMNIGAEPVELIVFYAGAYRT